MRTARLICVATLSVIASSRAFATDPFATPLAPEKRVVHALNRLTYGFRASDAADVSRTGVAAIGRGPEGM